MKKDCESLILGKDAIEDPIHGPHYIYTRDIVGDFKCKEVCGWAKMEVCSILEHSNKIEQSRKNGQRKS